MEMSFTSGKKLTPGPYRATKLWNGIVKQFREKMLSKKHRRHLRTYNDCFTSSDAIDFLHQLLKINPNIGKEVTRQQTLQLLRKFLKNHVIEDVQGRWGSENFDDDGKLFRFPPNISIAQTLRHPLGAISENVAKGKKNAGNKKQKKKAAKTASAKENEAIAEKETELQSAEIGNADVSVAPEPLKRSLPPLPAAMKCRVFPHIVDASTDEVWKDVLLEKLTIALELDTLEDVLVKNTVNGEWIKNNATKIGRSGVVQVDKEKDIPYWALSAMTCLANWPNGKDTGLPCYPGFEKDVFKAVCDYYCCSHNQSSTENNNKMNQSAANRDLPKMQPEPLLSYGFYELFTNILCLLQPKSEHLAIEALRYGLLLLPTVNRRKLHLLLRLMSKMSHNPHLQKLGGNVSTRTLLLHTFSRYILSCNEEVYLDELLAMRLVTFLIDHHIEVMKVPSDVERSVQERLTSRASDSGSEADGSYVQYTFMAPTNGETKPRILLKSISDQTSSTNYSKRKSNDLMKSWDRLFRQKQSSQNSLNASGKSEEDGSLSGQFNMISDYQPFTRKYSRVKRLRSNTVTNRVLGNGIHHPSRNYLATSPVPDMNESKMKPAKSCSDIFDMKISPTSVKKFSSKSSELASSSWNLRLRPSAMFGNPFSKKGKQKSKTDI